MTRLRRGFSLGFGVDLAAKEGEQEDGRGDKAAGADPLPSAVGVKVTSMKLVTMTEEDAELRVRLADASDCQHRLETEAARLPDHSHQRSIAQHLTRLAADMISEAGLG